MSAAFQAKRAAADPSMLNQEAQLAVFRVGAEMYGLDIMRIREIIRLQKLTMVPNAPPFIEGVLNLRGAVIPVMDLRKRFSQPQGTEKKTRIIICVLHGKVIGLIVDDVMEVRRCTRADIQPPPQFMRGPGTECFFGVCHHGEDMILLLDLEKILSFSEQHDLESIRQSGPD